LGQRNLNLVSSQQSIKPLLDKLALAPPAHAELQLLYGMHDCGRSSSPTRRRSPR
jgi:hypothetical protein